MTSLEHEAAWWGSCANTFHEEEKQLVYASYLGLFPNRSVAHPPTFNLGERSVLDIGGGPVSLLLKCVNFRRGTVVDPCVYPTWVGARYRECGIEYVLERGEDFRREKPWYTQAVEEVQLRDGTGKIRGYSRAAHFLESRDLDRYDECWIYNVLQHVDDPEEVCHTARREAYRVRIFDWVDVPTDALHGHTLTKADLDSWLDVDGRVTAVHQSGAVGTAYHAIVG